MDEVRGGREGVSRKNRQRWVSLQARSDGGDKASRLDGGRVGQRKRRTGCGARRHSHGVKRTGSGESIGLLSYVQRLPVSIEERAREEIQ